MMPSYLQKYATTVARKEKSLFSIVSETHLSVLVTLTGRTEPSVITVRAKSKTYRHF